MFKPITFILALSFLLLVACNSRQERRVDESALVRVAIVKLVNVSKQPLYDYLSESVSDATQNSMDNKFIYFHVPAAATQAVFAELNGHEGMTGEARLREHALAMDADLIIFGSYKTFPGKRGDSIEILITIFRADRAEKIGQISRKTAISGTIFREIDTIAAELVARIVQYRKSQLQEQGQNEAASGSGAKIELTRDSINIAPFIPPIF